MRRGFGYVFGRVSRHRRLMGGQQTSREYGETGPGAVMRAQNICKVCKRPLRAVHRRRSPRIFMAVMLRRTSSPGSFWAAGSAMLVLLALLATLQYRWLGKVSDAEKQRMLSRMQAGA